MSLPTAQSRCFVAASQAARRGYTLIEVLVVAVIIVLMLGLALPVFRAITGSRSEAGASNMIAAMLGRARTDAVGLQQPIGVAFFYNTSTQRTYMAEVEFPTVPAWVMGQQVPPQGYVSVTSGGVTYYYINIALITEPMGAPPSPPAETVEGMPAMQPVGGPPLEIVPNTDPLPLPAGIGVQTITNCQFNTNGVRQTDGYLNFGVILFDGYGRMTSQNYGVSQYSNLAKLGNLSDLPSTAVVIGNNGQFGMPSQFGLVVFQHEAFAGQNFPNANAASADPAYTASSQSSYSAQESAYTTGSPSQLAEENWLDQNATPLLLDRYSGTLIKAE